VPPPDQSLDAPRGVRRAGGRGRTESAPTGEPATRARAAGRPLDASRDAAILRATQEILAESGYDLLTIEAVALRARAGKATVYRRWPSKAELVVDAVYALRPATPVPDTGSLRGDLRAAYERIGSIDELGNQVMAGLMTARRRDPDLDRLFREYLWPKDRSEIASMFERAIERGEIAPDLNLDALTVVVAALTGHRLLFAMEPMDERYIDMVVDEVILPLTAANAGRASPPS
jgi:AcrR family transcriptional regulator